MLPLLIPLHCLGRPAVSEITKEDTVGIDNKIWLALVAFRNYNCPRPSKTQGQGEYLRACRMPSCQRANVVDPRITPRTKC